MQNFDILKRSTPGESFRVKSIMGKYDLQTSTIEEHFKGSIDLPQEWNIGLIVGRSGSGKTTIAKELFGDYIVAQYSYTHDSILDDMPQNVSVSEISQALTSVGFSSPTSWLKPYSVLSNGEKMRCDLARAILEKKELFAFDEFTSVVDRNVAKIGSLAMQKAIRNGGGKFIAISCHEDIQEWLMPDWVFNTDTMTFSRYDLEEQKKNRPDIKLDIYETNHKQEYWQMFSKYHYLAHHFNQASKTFVAFANGQLCAFAALLAFPHPVRKNLYKIHRLVVFPDYQGVGIATKMCNMLGEYMKSHGKDLSIVTSNSAMVYSLKRNPFWKCIHIGRNKISKTTLKTFIATFGQDRITTTFEYTAAK